MDYGGKRSSLKTALVLSGGGSKGALEVGVLKVILKKIIPDVIIGTSIGSANGAMIASGAAIEELENVWRSMDKKMIFPFNYKLLYKMHLSDSIYSNRSWYAFLKGLFGNKRFSSCKIPLYINATKLSSGEGVFFHRGKLVDAIMASSAVPPYFPPYEINGVRYVDGAFSDFIGTEEALALRCKQIIIVNLGYGGQPEHYKKGVIKITNHAIELLTYQSLKKEIELCEHDNVVEIEPKKAFEIHISDFSHTEELIREGEKEGKKALRKIIV